MIFKHSNKIFLLSNYGVLEIGDGLLLHAADDSDGAAVTMKSQPNTGCRSSLVPSPFSYEDHLDDEL